MDHFKISALVILYQQTFCLDIYFIYLCLSHPVPLTTNSSIRPKKVWRSQHLTFTRAHEAGTTLTLISWKRKLRLAQLA